MHPRAVPKAGDERRAFGANQIRCPRHAPPRELASFFREFPHKEFQPGPKAWDADAVLGAAVVSGSALQSVLV